MAKKIASGKINSPVQHTLSSPRGQTRKETLSSPRGKRGIPQVDCQTVIEFLDSEIKMRLDALDEKVSRMSSRLERGGFRGGGSGPIETPRGRRSSIGSGSIEEPERTDRDANVDSELAPLLREETLVSARASFSLEFLNKGNRRRGRWVERVTNFLDDPDFSESAYWFHKARTCIIMTSVFTTFVQGIDPPPVHGMIAAIAETTFDSLFALEVLFRYVFCPNRWAFFTDIYNLIDLLSAAPLFLRTFLGFVVRLRSETAATYFLLCAVPVLRLLKMLRGFHQIHLLARAFRQAFEALPVLLFTMMIIILTFSSMIYVVEPRDNIDSLPTAVWLSIVTMTTVGYGDVTPTSGLGYVVIAVLVISSVLYMAMPLGIIGYSFTQIWKDRDRILLTQRTRDRLLQWGYTALDIRKVFQHFDVDGGGELDLDEFREMMDQMNIGLNDERIIELFMSFDSDGGGTVDEKEFVRNLFPAEFGQIYGESRSKQNSARMSSLGEIG